ncbi:MAG: LysR substrate-binding domain-containing protein [Roseomonas mucosa]|nr:LysR substrate-binding domain-containing protein [Roseomonas mucosa]
MTAYPSPQQLRYLVALADHGHFGRAATACAVSQSTLSAGIIALERQLATAILDRGPSKRPAFTQVGLEIVQRARDALATLSAVAETAATAHDPLSGPLRFGLIPTVGPFLLPRLMPALRGAFPRLRLWLREDLTQNLVADLEGGRLDLLLLALPVASADRLDVMPLAEDPFLAALPPAHRLAARNILPASALSGERLGWPAASASRCSPGWRWRAACWPGRMWSCARWRTRPAGCWASPGGPAPRAPASSRTWPPRSGTCWRRAPEGSAAQAELHQQRVVRPPLEHPVRQRAAEVARPPFTAGEEA